jgi:hypothetical protein
MDLEIGLSAKLYTHPAFTDVAIRLVAKKGTTHYLVEWYNVSSPAGRRLFIDSETIPLGAKFLANLSPLNE